MEHKENGVYQLQQWLYIAIRKGTFGAMFELWQAGRAAVGEAVCLTQVGNANEIS